VTFARCAMCLRRAWCASWRGCCTIRVTV